LKGILVFPGASHPAAQLPFGDWRLCTDIRKTKIFLITAYIIAFQIKPATVNSLHYGDRKNMENPKNQQTLQALTNVWWQNIGQCSETKFDQ